MAARRLARPALLSPLPAEQMPDQQGGGLTGAGGHGHDEATSGGFFPSGTSQCLGAASLLGTNGVRGHQNVAGKPEVRMGESWSPAHQGLSAGPKITAKPMGELQPPSALSGGTLTPWHCSATAAPARSQRSLGGGPAATLVPARLPQQSPDPSPRSPAIVNQAAKLRLIPLQQHIPPPCLRAECILGD